MEVFKVDNSIFHIFRSISSTLVILSGCLLFLFVAEASVWEKSLIVVFLGVVGILHSREFLPPQKIDFLPLENTIRFSGFMKTREFSLSAPLAVSKLGDSGLAFLFEDRRFVIYGGIEARDRLYELLEGNQTRKGKVPREVQEPK
ncbi:MAG: hypothetical protein JJ934_08245 [Pseudomonadales bacterium]|nr:hypothetical protein [Pseudomonadales bacterium]